METVTMSSPPAACVATGKICAGVRQLAGDALDPAGLETAGAVGLV
jgi:hypothetical protein